MEQAQLVEQLKRLVDEHGRVKAAELLGVNFRTLAASIESGKLSRRMGESVRKYAKAAGSQATPTPHVDDEAQALEKRVADLEEEVGTLQGIVEEQSEEFTRLAARVEQLEQTHDEGRESDQVTEAPKPPVISERAGPKQTHASPDVVTLEPQANEEFGPATALVDEWRLLRTRDCGGKSKVERAKAEERRWDLEVAMIEQFGLTLPPETEPLTASDMETHLEWRRETLRRVRRERTKAERIILLRRIATLGLWWR